MGWIPLVEDIFLAYTDFFLPSVRACFCAGILATDAQHGLFVAAACEDFACNFRISHFHKGVPRLFFHYIPLQRSSFRVLPRGRTQAEIVALDMNGIKMDEGLAVDNAGTVFFERIIMRPGAVPFMLFKSIQRVLRGQFHHESVAQNLRRDRGE